MANKKRPGGLSTVASFMSQSTQEQLAATSAESYLLLLALRPDPGQPRHLLSAELAQALFSNALTPLEVLKAWQEEALRGDQAARHTLAKLEHLADSIAQHGLINPITVRRPRPEEDLPPDVSHLVVTGERRYWAHLLLLSQGRPIRLGNESHSAEQIAVRETAEGTSIRAHQLIENLLREDINAVEKAQGLWALRYELSGIPDTTPPRDPRLLPWTTVEESLGISRRYRIYLTNVLALSAPAQLLVQHHQMSERLIRPIVQELRNQPELQLEALEQLARWQSAEETEDTSQARNLSQSVERLVKTLQELPEEAPLSASNLTVRSIRRRVQGALRDLGELGPEEFFAATQSGDSQLEADLRALHNHIASLLARLQQ